MNIEIGEKFGVTESAAQTAVSRALRELIKTLSNDYKVLGIKPPQGHRSNLFL